MEAKEVFLCFCAGSTLGRAQVPSYRDGKGQRHMLPREYPKCRRGESGYNSLRQPWFIQMFKDIESIALYFVYFTHAKWTPKGRNNSFYNQE